KRIVPFISIFLFESNRLVRLNCLVKKFSSNWGYFSGHQIPNAQSQESLGGFSQYCRKIIINIQNITIDIKEHRHFYRGIDKRSFSRKLILEDLIYSFAMGNIPYMYLNRWPIPEIHKVCVHFDLDPFSIRHKKRGNKGGNRLSLHQFPAISV